MTEEKKEENLTPEEIVKYFKDKLKTKIKDSKIVLRKAGTNKKPLTHIWIKVEKDGFKTFVQHLVDLFYPHLAVVSGNDNGKIIELIYHFSIYNDTRCGQINLNVSVDLPKSKPEIETICDWIPGALVTEREKQEMLGVKVVGIPDTRKLFLPEDWPKGVYPWRRDETGPEKYYKNLHEVKK